MQLLRLWVSGPTIDTVIFMLYFVYVYVFVFVLGDEVGALGYPVTCELVFTFVVYIKLFIHSFRPVLARVMAMHN